VLLLAGNYVVNGNEKQLSESISPFRIGLCESDLCATDG